MNALTNINNWISINTNDKRAIAREIEHQFSNRFFRDIEAFSLRDLRFEIAVYESRSIVGDGYELR